MCAAALKYKTVKEFNEHFSLKQKKNLELSLIHVIHIRKIMEFKIKILFILLILPPSLQTRKRSANFYPKSSFDQEAGLTYILIEKSVSFGLLGENTLIQCMDVCMNHEACRSFYVNDGACVFGVNETNDFDGHFVIHTRPINEILHTKGKKLAPHVSYRKLHCHIERTFLNGCVCLRY